MIICEDLPMKHYLSPTGELYAYEEDGSQDSYIPATFTALTEAEVEAIRAKQALDSAPTPEQLMEIAQAKRDSLLATATLRIAPLQDAVDLDEASPAEVASLKQWKQYRVLVNRVSGQVGYPGSITWPEQPS